MAIKTNTFLTFSAKGIREDLSDIISNISPTRTPFQTAIGKGKAAESTYFEWQQDALASAAANAQLEAQDYDSAGLTAVTPTVRVGNYCQISAKTVVIGGTTQKVKKAGRKDEMAYQIAKMGKELKRDIEYSMLNNQAAVAGNSTTARQTGSVQAWVKTNVSKASDGSNPSYTTVPNATRTDGTQRNFTEALLKAAMQLCYSSGGEPTMVMMGPVNKQNFSGFAGIAAQRFNAKGAAPTTVIGAVDVYVSDFGNLAAVPNLFQRERDVHLVDPEMYSMAMLRDYNTEELAKTGDADKRLLLAEWGLRCENEAGNGIIADLNTTLI